ncbi:hypothetical protein SLEP1_g57517 [Rubroshorea leprosula]|uniref:Uncharacterized protein n=1 Tax=Rubroshorea leprosula TaxID=152421 RepID=A0AAV5MQ25_9ROSI|nr:hypothetical protein SLEP1_g57517 [Rubroshorea leprosula]
MSISAVPSFVIALFPISAIAFFFICSDQCGFLIHQLLNYSKTILLRDFRSLTSLESR